VPLTASPPRNFLVTVNSQALALVLKRGSVVVKRSVKYHFCFDHIRKVSITNLKRPKLNRNSNNFFLRMLTTCDSSLLNIILEHDQPK
jgi:hypothetical protein